MTDSITQASTAISQTQVQQQVNMRALRADMDSSKAQAEQISEMAGDASSRGSQIAQDPALGQQVNLMA
ncbi:MAG: putative motility protein [Spirochaetales bacterium]